MCGIVTQFSRNGRTVKEEALWRATHELHHRGPDAHGAVEVVGTRRSAVLGAVRLRILDLSDRPDQPMRSDDGAVTLCFNGEIYNFKELRHELATAGHRFSTTSDTECILRLVEHRLPAHEHAEAILRGVVRVGEDLAARGWVDHVVEPATLTHESVALATELAAMSPLAYATTKEMRNRVVVRAFDTFDATSWAKALEHPDSRAALARTLEKLAKR